MQFTKIVIALVLQTAAVLAAPPVSPEDAAVNAAVPQGVSLSLWHTIEDIMLINGGVVLRLLPGTTRRLPDLLQLGRTSFKDAAKLCIGNFQFETQIQRFRGDQNQVY